MEANKWRFLVDRLVGYLADGTELHYVEIGGPKDVAKPTVTEQGHALCSMSIAIEDDSGDAYFYNETSGWGKMFSFAAE